MEGRGEKTGVKGMRGVKGGEVRGGDEDFWAFSPRFKFANTPLPVSHMCLSFLSVHFFRKSDLQ